MFSQSNRPASALLLTVMIIAILTTTTLASIAVRFDQLASTDKIANSAVAKSAADSGLAKLKEAINAGPVNGTTLFDLDTNETSTISTSSAFRPSPRKIVSTYEKSATSLPRCLAVAVLAPWVNDGKYLNSDQQSSNPALLFNYANIVNDTPLGIIPGNGALGGNGVTAEKDKTLSEFTNMGHFYNPYAPVGSAQGDVAYWSVRMGGPNDQFLTKTSADGTSSYYKNLDFIYLPYLPRFQDSGLSPNESETGIERLTAGQLTKKFEDIIKNNNFRVWLDASVDDATLSQYGFGDLFSGSSEYRVNWLQPALWNDSSEADLIGPYVNTDADLTAGSWSKKELPLKTFGAPDGSWKTSIIKGSKPFSFIKLSSAESGKAFAPGAEIDGLLYGSLEGLRLNQKITFSLLNKANQSLLLKDRSLDQGKFYNVILINIGPKNVSGGVESINVKFKLSAVSYDTPVLASGSAAEGSDISTIVIQANPQFSTTRSNSSVTIGVGTEKVPVTLDSNCAPSAGGLTSCPAVGDLVGFSKSGNKPLWGKVNDVEFTSGGSKLDKIFIDKLREGPKPVREMASTYFTSSNSPRIAYYGGAIAMNDYDGGYASESDELWIYDPENNVWSYPIDPSGTSPGKRAGASMVFDNTGTNNRLVVVGGYYHEPINISTPSINCEINQPTCLYTNRPGLRVAKRVTNDVYAFNIVTNAWSKIDYSSVIGAGDKIVNGTNYTIRTTSTLADRSGLEGWKMSVKNDPNITQQSIDMVSGIYSTLTVSPSTAGIANGDQVFISGITTTNSSFYTWGDVQIVNNFESELNIKPYGYKHSGASNFVYLKSFNIQVIKRQEGVTSCDGGKSVSAPYKYFCNLADDTGFAVGDSVVLEEYNATKTELINVLSGYIAFLSVTKKAYFVAYETNSTIKDFSDLSSVSTGVTDESPLKLPTMRYGANLSTRSTTGPQNNVYSQGAAKNINNYNRAGDVWNLAFTSGVLTGPDSAVWSFLPQRNDPAADLTGPFNFQVIRSQTFHQFSTTSTIAENPEKNPELKKKEIDDPKTGEPTVPPTKAWDNDQYWQLDIDPNDQPRISVGAQVLLEKRSETGARLTWHGIVPDYYSENDNDECGALKPQKLCIKHNSSYPNDVEFLAASGQTANAKVSLSYYTSTESSIGTGTWQSQQRRFQLTNPEQDRKLLPAVGSTIMVWSTGLFPIKAFTMVVKDRVGVGNNPNLFNFTPYGDTEQGMMLPSPPQNAFMTTALATSGLNDSIISMGDHLFQSSGVGAAEWFTTIAATSEWKVRLAMKSTVDDRPSPRKAGSAVSITTDGATKMFVAGGTFGNFATLWRQTAAGNTVTNGAEWNPQFSATVAASDLPNLAGGSLVGYNQGTNKLVWFGGKQKTDFSSKDYGQSIGPIMLGRPDIDRYSISDNSFYMDSPGATSASPTWGFTHAIEENLSSPINSTFTKSLSFKAGGIASTYGNGTVCAYIGQSSNCSIEQLMSNLGVIGRMDGGNNASYGGYTWGRTNIINAIGSKFLSSTGAVGGTPSLIMSAPSYSGYQTNGRYDQDGYRPYICDKAAGGLGALGGPVCQITAYGQLATSLTSDKTAAISAFSKLEGGGALLVTTNGIGRAVVSNRGGSTGTAGGWYSYCAKSELKLIQGTTTPELKNGLYQCDATATRYMSTLPDPEDLLFTLNAAITLSSVDAYKVVGYYGGIKRGYQVITRTGADPTVIEIVP